MSTKKITSLPAIIQTTEDDIDVINTQSQKYTSQNQEADSKSYSGCFIKRFLVECVLFPHPSHSTLGKTFQFDLLIPDKFSFIFVLCFTECIDMTEILT